VVTALPVVGERGSNVNVNADRPGSFVVVGGLIISFPSVPCLLYTTIPFPFSPLYCFNFEFEFGLTLSSDFLKEAMAN
jgi:hypothetical protein